MAPARLDRLATLVIFDNLRRLMPACRSGAVTILMYHSVSDDLIHGAGPYYETGTSPRVFEEHLKFLKENGYEVVSLKTAAEGLKSRSGRPAGPHNPVVITFDDGFSDFHTAAHPLLKKYGFPATVFLPTGLIGQSAPGVSGRVHLTWEEVGELDRGGVEFGSHTVTHPRLVSLGRDEIERELRESHRTLVERLGKADLAFSFPYAFPEGDPGFVGFIRETIKGCGYTCGVSTRIGTAAPDDDIYSLKRIPVNTYDDPALFRAKLEGSYDWLYWPQFLKKKVRALAG